MHCVDTGGGGGTLGAPVPPDFEARYVLYICIRVFVVHKVPTKVERFYKPITNHALRCQVVLQLYVHSATPESS